MGQPTCRSRVMVTIGADCSRVARATTPGPPPQPHGWVRLGFEVSRFPHFWVGGLACAEFPRGVEFRGSLAPKKKKHVVSLHVGCIVFSSVHLIGNQDHACLDPSWNLLESPVSAWAANKTPDENTLGVFHHVQNCIHVIGIQASCW